MSKAKILSLLSQRGSKKLADQTKREAMNKANLRDMINEDPSLARNLDDKEFQDLMDDISDPSSMRGDTFASEDYENTLRMIKDMSPEDVAKQVELFRDPEDLKEYVSSLSILEKRKFFKNFKESDPSYKTLLADEMEEARIGKAEGSLMETPKVTDNEKAMYGEDAARYTSGYNSYMEERKNAETPQQLETIEKRFKQFEDTFDSKAITVALRLMDEERIKKTDGNIVRPRDSIAVKDRIRIGFQQMEEAEENSIKEIKLISTLSNLQKAKNKKEKNELENIIGDKFSVFDKENRERAKKATQKAYDAFFISKSSKDKLEKIINSSPEERIKKAPGGKAFPDLTGDGKVTQADILKGRGVFGHGGESSISILVPMERMPVDTYPNIPPEEMEEALESQLPDDEMEDKYVDYILSESLSDNEQEYLMDALEKDERLSDIMDKVITVAGEFTGEGEVKGPGTGVSDSIPARLSDGEFVFTRKATDQIGAEKLQKMMDDAERDYDKGELKKMAFGGMNRMMDDPTMDDRRRRQADMFGIMPEDEQEEEIKRQMISSNRMPSVR